MKDYQVRVSYRDSQGLLECSQKRKDDQELSTHGDTGIMASKKELSRLVSMSSNSHVPVN